ncbi:hypothetical protein DOTSEDRAFT_21942 [Dothistroma septosporum NZE10]|uniref:Uncharacterized protein n=1 Tax=Dothistroma septosporum (strain NZE10 / CBS 128990) TaxID=675120 RepID=N1PXH7_DOTSN|nr:hypothetical protein DOTSEDRAFT_21942 [Dothistroma septosporum NZE10]
MYGSIAVKDIGNIKSFDSSKTLASNNDRLIVVARYHEDLTWTKYVEESKANIPIKLIAKDDVTNPDNLNSNNMTESTSYLYYLIKYYDSLPKVVAFVHGHGDPMLLRDEVWTVTQYTALPHPGTTQSCNTHHEEERGLLVWIGTAEDEHGSPLIFPYDKGESDEADQYQRAFHSLFEFLRTSWEEGGMGMTVPRVVTTLCCSAFSVPGEAVRRVPREKYRRLFEYLEGSDDRDVGVAMEYVWTLLFGEEAWI